jgi:S1-C subfamily serine protease
MKAKSDSIVRIISNNVEIDIFSPFRIQSDNESIGTGFFINDKGYILTCAHVVNGSIKISVNVPLEGKKKIPVEIHSICYDKDLALLKTIDYKNKNFCNLGNSNKINSGDSVTAMGYPLGQDRLKTTKGVISGIQDRYIQTDTPINPGNSGGPLFDENMNVIGVNTAKISSFLAENIGYASPINDFILILKQMMSPPSNKIIREPVLYFEIQHTTENHCKLFKCPETPGCIVKQLVKDSPMYLAGLRENDILISFDKYKLDGSGDVDVEWSSDKIHIYDLLPKYAQNAKIKIVFWSLKDKKCIEKEIVLDNGNMYKINHVRYPLEQIVYEIFAGMIIMELNMNHLENLKLTEYPIYSKFTLQKYKDIKKRTQNVVFISNILQGSYMSSLDDVKSGSIITNVNGECVFTLNDVKNAILTKSLRVDGKTLIYIRLEDKNQIIIDVNDAFKEEQILMPRYKYGISDLYIILNH